MSAGHWQEREDGSVFWWPDCIVPGCPNSICLAKGETRFCWPHSASGQSLNELLDARAGLVEITPDEEAQWLIAHGKITTTTIDGKRYRVLEPGENPRPRNAPETVQSSVNESGISGAGNTRSPSGAA